MLYHERTVANCLTRQEYLKFTASSVLQALLKKTKLPLSITVKLSSFIT